MSVTTVLLHILIVLLAAKVGAEVSERIGVPAVVGEILAGVVVGGSVLGLVEGDEVLHVLGEIGVILLLFEVGLEMDLAELGAVGRASLAVAVIGVVVPFAAGIGAGLAFDMSTNEALFVAAALTATSVGITARVFGDLRALATVEARTVLGAAIADDVIGLVILTVVVRLVSEGSVSVVSVLGIVGVAVLFLVAATSIGVRLAPPLFAWVARFGRSPGTFVAVALAFTLAISELANAAKLAPIVGAFVAGLSLSRSPHAHRIRRELTPVGHLFIPVFFLAIGIDVKLDQFTSGRVLLMAAVLLMIAVGGKLVSAVGMFRAPGDRLAVGIGMIPRGEVGLIFAAIGLREHVFGQDVYGALLLVVLATTLLTPPALRSRLLRVQAGHRPGGRPTDVEPAGGWLRVVDGRRGRTLDLAAEPAGSAVLEVAFRAALVCEEARPSDDLLEWLANLPPTRPKWTAEARRQLFDVLEHGGPRAWRFLAVTGVLDRALPELGEAIARRQGDAAELDPIGALQWPRLSRLHEHDLLDEVRHPEWVRLAAVMLDATDDASVESPTVVARRIVQRLDVGAAIEESVAQMVGDAELVQAASRRPDAFTEEAVLQLASHLRTTQQARSEFALARAGEDLDHETGNRLDELERLVLASLAQPQLTSRDAVNSLDLRRSQASSLTADQAVRERIECAPRAFALATDPEALAAGAALCEPPPGWDTVRLDVAEEPDATGCRRATVAARDRPGLLARVSGVFSRAGLEIVDATVGTWGDGCAVSSFRVRGPLVPAREPLERALRDALSEDLQTDPAPDVALAFDDTASPWHTVCTARARDRLGLLHLVTGAFAAAGVNVHAARLATVDDEVIDVFELTDAKGRKLDSATQQRVERLLASGVETRRRRWVPARTRA